MKRIILAVAVLMLMAGPVMASSAHLTTGIMLDTPKLIKLPFDLSLGFEGGKDIQSDGFFWQDKDFFESDKGYFVMVKFTWGGTLLDLSGKK